MELFTWFYLNVMSLKMTNVTGLSLFPHRIGLVDHLN